MKKFETPKIETIEFAVEDVITVSGDGPVTPGNPSVTCMPMG